MAARPLLTIVPRMRRSGHQGPEAGARSRCSHHLDQAPPRPPRVRFVRRARIPPGRPSVSSAIAERSRWPSGTDMRGRGRPRSGAREVGAGDRARLGARRRSPDREGAVDPSCRQWKGPSRSPRRRGRSLSAGQCSSCSGGTSGLDRYLVAARPAPDGGHKLGAITVWSTVEAALAAFEGDLSAVRTLDVVTSAISTASPRTRRPT